MTYTRTDRLCLVVNFEYLSFLGEGGVIDGKIEERAAGCPAHFKLKPPVH